MAPLRPTGGRDVRRRKGGGLPFLSLLADACADARIPVPLPESSPPVTGVHLGLTPESTFVAPRSELLSLSSVVPPSDEMADVEQRAKSARKKRPALAYEDRTPPRPRRSRRRRVDPSPVARSGGTGSDGDLPSPQIAARRRREIKRRRYQPPVDEQTDWDPAPPAAMEAHVRRSRKVAEPTRTVTTANAERAEKIFESAIAAYVKGDLESAAADAMLARVFDPTHDGYARAEHDWTDALRQPGRLLCSSQHSASSTAPSPASSSASPPAPSSEAPTRAMRRRRPPILSAEAP